MNLFLVGEIDVSQLLQGLIPFALNLPGPGLTAPQLPVQPSKLAAHSLMLTL